MTAWDDVRAQIESHSSKRVAACVRGLDAADRRAVAKELPGYVRDRRAAHPWGDLDDKLIGPLLVAGAGTMSGAAATATWLCRADLRMWGDGRHFSDLVNELVDDRPVEWRAEVAQRIAGRLRATPERWQDRTLWQLAAGLIRGFEVELPADDAFVVGWVQWGGGPKGLHQDEFLDALVPRLFEADGVGATLRWHATQVHANSWAGTLKALADKGRLKREALLDGCVSRFLLGGRVNDLRWFIGMHDVLSPTEAESIQRVRDYVRLLPAAPGPVAELALREVLRVDAAVGLDETAFADAADAVLFRPEKKLVRTALTWLDRTARKRDRVNVTVHALTVAFALENLDLRERAVKTAVKHAAKADDETRQIVRDAAAALPAELRDLVAASCGEVDAVDAPPPPLAPPPPFAPRELPAPIASPAELAEELIVNLRGNQGWPDMERLLTGMVEFANREPDQTRDTFERVVRDAVPWLNEAERHLGDQPWTWLAMAARAVMSPQGKRGLASLLTRKRPALTAAMAGKAGDPMPHRVILTRMREVADSIGKTPVLLAAPTTASGHIDPEVLLDRMRRLEEAGVQPGAAELDQAMLRIPRDIGADTVARAWRLSSPAGRALAMWLATGGLPDPTVSCTNETKLKPAEVWASPSRRTDYIATTRIMPTVKTDTQPPGDIAGLCHLPQSGQWTKFPGGHYYGPVRWWPSLMPSHREVIAAHLLPYLPDWTEDQVGQGAALIALAESDGPAGPAMATALGYGLSSRHQNERAGAVDALLILSGRGRLPAPELGTALATLIAQKVVKLNRVTTALDDAARAGAYGDIWHTIEAALPSLLPAAGQRSATGLADLLALATQAVEATGTRVSLPHLAALTDRGGSSRLAREATRLHRTLTTA